MAVDMPLSEEDLLFAADLEADLQHALSNEEDVSHTMPKEKHDQDSSMDTPLITEEDLSFAAELEQTISIDEHSQEDVRKEEHGQDSPMDTPLITEEDVWYLENMMMISNNGEYQDSFDSLDDFFAGLPDLLEEVQFHDQHQQEEEQVQLQDQQEEEEQVQFHDQQEEEEEQVLQDQEQATAITDSLDDQEEATAITVAPSQPPDYEDWTLAVPPGVKFRPTDVQLINNYLKVEYVNGYIPRGIISTLDVYDYEPHQLPALAVDHGDGKYYFFTRVKKLGKSKCERIVKSKIGFWRATQSKIVRDKNGTKIGHKLSLTYIENKVKTPWLMTEYKLESNSEHSSDYELVLAVIYYLRRRNVD